jgi:FkbM family methyltransferase
MIKPILKSISNKFHCFYNNKGKEEYKKSEHNKIFIDLGFHFGQGLKKFNKKLAFDKNWIIHVFEPNPLLHPLKGLEHLNDLNIIVHKKAAWTKNGFGVFKQYGTNGLSQGSLLQLTGGDKEYDDYFDSVKVETIDFFEFLKSFDESTEIYIKMDIEWAEYNIIEDFLIRGWPININHIWIEWHGLTNSFFKKKSNFLIEEIKKTGTNVIKWH